MRRWVLVVAALVVLVGGCGDDASETTAGTEAPTTEPGALPHGLTRCDHDAPLLAGDEALYLDEPVYVGNEQPVDQVRAWAQDQPGFEEIWVDRDRNGWIGVGFSEGAEERQAELAERFIGVGVVAVPMEWTDAELGEVVDEAVAALREAGNEDAYGNTNAPYGAASVWVGVLDEATLAPLAPFADTVLCVDGVEAADAVADGPQPTEGDHWRILADERTEVSDRTGVATTTDQYEALWAEAALSSARPEVDLDTEVVVWFGLTENSCPVRLDDVLVDEEQALVHPDAVVPGNPSSCDDVGIPHTFVVALDRSRLPAPPFAIGLGPERHDGSVEALTVVDADLRSPGSTATDDQIHPDEALLAAADDPDPIEPGDVFETGYPVRVDLDLGCELTVIGPYNDTAFAADRTVVPPPPEWAAVADEDGIVRFALLMDHSPARLTLSAGGVSVPYSPTEADPTASC